MHKKAIQLTRNAFANPLFSGSALLIGGSLFGNAINYIYHLVIGRALGPEGYGVLASLYSILYMVSIVPISSSLSIVKFISAAKNEKEQSIIYHSVKTIITKIALVGGAIIIILSPIIANFLHISSLINVLLVAPIFVLSLMMLVNQSTSQGRLKFMGMVLPNITMSIVKLVLGIGLVLLGFSVFGAMVGVVVGAIVAFLISRPFVASLQKPVKKTFDLSSFFRYSGPVFLQAIAFTSIMSTDVILVRHFFSEFDAGLYAAVSTLGRIIYFAAQPVTGAMFPVVSKRVAAGEPYLKVFIGALGITVVIAFFVLTLYAFLPKLAITVLYGQKYASAAGHLLWMGSFYTIYTIAYFITNFFLSRGKTIVAYLAIAISILQVILISMYHSSILVVIQISLVLMIIFCTGLFGYFYIDRKNL